MRSKQVTPKKLNRFKMSYLLIVDIIDVENRSKRSVFRMDDLKSCMTTTL